MARGRPRRERDNEPMPPDIRKPRWSPAVVFVLVLAFLFLQDALLGRRGVETIPYSEFQAYVRDGKVARVTVLDDRLEGELTEAVDGKTRFVTVRVAPEVARELGEHGVPFEGRTEGTFVTLLLSWLIPIAFVTGIWAFLARRAASGLNGPGGGLLAIGKSKAKVYVETDTKVTFADVAGVDEAKSELQEVVEFLKNPRSYGRLGARMPRGVLLVGPPGTGKTLLARAVAGEAGVPFFSISGSEFVEMFVGVGAARVRDLFEQARLKAPAIIFVDELDALGRARSSFPGLGGHEEKEQTLNQLLSELDGFDPSSGIVLLGATNRPEILDPALLRAGRFDRQVLVDRPDKIGRQQILRVHTRKVRLAPDVDLAQVAALTPGFSGADLANLVNEAALVATRRGAPDVALPDFTAAVERIVAGLEKRNRLLNQREREIVAHHELGHAIVATALPGCDPVHKVSIIPRGIGALGYTIQRPTEDRYLMAAEELENKMAMLLGGRAAEDLVYGRLSTGAADDLAKATDIARNMIVRYGMGGKLGAMAYETEPGSFLGDVVPPRRLYSEQTAREIDVAVRDKVEAAFERARRVLRENGPLLEEAARELLAHETLADADLAAVLARVRPEPPRIAAAGVAQG
jgi:cell division protease FtsH